MKATLIVIENENDHVQAKALAAKLMVSEDPRDAAKLAAQARLIADYERRRWPRRVPTTAEVLSYLMEQHGFSRADLVPLLGTCGAG